MGERKFGYADDRLTPVDRAELHAVLEQFLREADASIASVSESKVSPNYFRLIHGEIGPTEYAQAVKAAAHVTDRWGDAAAFERLVRLRFEVLDLQASLAANRSCESLVALAHTLGQSPASRLKTGKATSWNGATEPPLGSIRRYLALSWRFLILPFIASLGAAFVAVTSLRTFWAGTTVQFWEIWVVLLGLLAVHVIWRALGGVRLLGVPEGWMDAPKVVRRLAR